MERASNLNARALIRVLTRFDDPDIRILLLLELLVCVREFYVLRVAVVVCFHIESEWDGDLERIDAHS